MPPERNTRTSARARAPYEAKAESKAGAKVAPEAKANASADSPEKNRVRDEYTAMAIARPGGRLPLLETKDMMGVEKLLASGIAGSRIEAVSTDSISHPEVKTTQSHMVDYLKKYPLSQYDTLWYDQMSCNIDLTADLVGRAHFIITIASRARHLGTQSVDTLLKFSRTLPHHYLLNWYPYRNHGCGTLMVSATFVTSPVPIRPQWRCRAVSRYGDNYAASPFGTRIWVRVAEARAHELADGKITKLPAGDVRNLDRWTRDYGHWFN